MMYLAYKLNKQGDNIQPWHIPFLIWNQLVVPGPVLTVASWPAYRFLRRQVRWSGIPISLRIFHSLLWSMQFYFPALLLSPWMTLLDLRDLAGVISSCELYVLLPLSQEENNLRDIQYKFWEDKNRIRLVQKALYSQRPAQGLARRKSSGNTDGPRVKWGLGGH